MGSGSWARASRLTVVLLLAVLAEVPASTAIRSPLHLIKGGAESPVHEIGSTSDGDLIFRTGTDLLSGLVIAQTAEARFSHVGMIVRGEGETLVIHAIPPEQAATGGVMAEPIASFLGPSVSNGFGHYRIDGLTDHQRARIKEYLMLQVGKPFDYRFRYSEDGAFYCTELVLKALHFGDVDLLPFVPKIEVITLTEGVFAPDELARSRQLRQVPGSSRALF